MTQGETTWDGLPIAPEPPYGATVVVYGRDAGGLRLLLLHRAHHGVDYTGDWAWTPPAGSRLPGEPIRDCAARELLEEAGLSLDLRPLSTEDLDWVSYVAEAPSLGDVVLHDAEHDRYEWVEPQEALQRISPDVVARTVCQALEVIGSGDRGGSRDG